METLEQRIMRHEGFSPKLIADAKGMFEIGYGHDVAPADCAAWQDGISEEAAVALLGVDLEKIKTAAAKAFPWLLGLTDTRAGVIYEMCYQMGVAGVAGFTNMITAIREGKWFKVGDEMLNSEWNKETPARCAELANIMVKG